MAQVPDVADHEALRLLLLAVDEGASWPVGDPDVTAEVAGRFEGYVERRRGGEPLQYIEETVQFGPLELHIDSRALIPRPETERLWELAVDLVKGLDEPTIIDVGTGSGNLALAMKWIRPDSIVIGCDLSCDALDLARENAARLGLAVDFLIGDLLDPLPTSLRGEVDLIVSNPPYVARSEYEGLAAEVREHEPMEALVADTDGLGILNRIAVGAADWLRPGAAIICEIGETQGLACLDLFSGYSPRIEEDLTGRDRFVVGSAPMASDVH
ncbi:MAG: peptide chain release factor N(5)-glutamine methyltransferase [bacterium]|nr:peptide chain release factor N(5)-glutamine methyltransferase [bacterium]